MADAGLIRFLLRIHRPGAAAPEFELFTEEPGKAELMRCARRHKARPADCALFPVTAENRARLLLQPRWSGWNARLKLQGIALTAKATLVEPKLLGLELSDARGGMRFVSLKLDVAALDDEKLLRRISRALPRSQLGPCAECGRSGLLERKRCRTCLLEELRRRSEREAAKQERARARRFAGYREQGFSFVARIWVHPKAGGDDFAVEEPLRKRPGARALRELARRHGSALLDDVELLAL